MPTFHGLLVLLLLIELPLLLTEETTMTAFSTAAGTVCSIGCCLYSDGVPRRGMEGELDIIATLRIMGDSSTIRLCCFCSSLLLLMVTIFIYRMGYRWNNELQF